MKHFNNGQYHEYIGTMSDFKKELRYIPNLYYNLSIQSVKSGLLTKIEEVL